MSSMNSGPGYPMGGFGDRPGMGPGMGTPGRLPGASEPPKNEKGKKAKRTKGEARADKAVTRKVLNTQKIAAIVLAGVVAVLVFVLAGANEKKTYVVRVNTSISALAQISPSQMEAISLPESAIEQGAITAANAKDALATATELAAAGRARQALPKGRQLHPEDFSPEALLATPLAPDERLVSVEAKVSVAVGGQLRAGDRVDIVATADVSRPDANGVMQNETVSKVVVSNVEIVSVLPYEQTFDQASQNQASESQGKTPGELLPNDPVPGIYLVRAKVDQAKVLTLIGQSTSDLALVLRGADAADNVNDPAIGISDVFGATAGTPDSVPTSNTTSN